MRRDGDHGNKVGVDGWSFEETRDEKRDDGAGRTREKKKQECRVVYALARFDIARVVYDAN